MSYISKNDAYKISRVTSLPSTGDLGTLYLNTTTNTLWMYDGVNGWFTRLMFDDFVYDYYARYSDIPVGSYSNLTRKIIVLNDETDGGITNSYESVSGNLQKVLGKSAYQVAVDNGFIGSQSAWLISLQGEIGKALGFYNANTNTPTLTSIPSGSFNDGDYYDVSISGNAYFSGSNFTSGSAILVGDKIKKVGTSWYRQPAPYYNIPTYLKYPNLSFTTSEMNVMNSIRTLDITVPAGQKTNDWRITFVSTIPTDSGLVSNFKYRLTIRNLTTSTEFNLINENSTFDSSTINGIKTYRGNITVSGTTVSFNVTIDWKLLLDLGSNFQYFNTTTSNLQLKVGIYSQSTDILNTLGNYTSSDFESMKSLLQGFNEQSISPVVGQYVWNDGSVQTSSVRQYIYLNVSVGQRVKVTSTIGGSPMFLAVYFNASNIVIGSQFQGTNGVDTTYTTQELTIPTGCTKIAINSLNTYPFKVYLSGYIAGVGTKDIQDSNTSRISALENISKDYSVVSKTDTLGWVANNGTVNSSTSRIYTTITVVDTDQIKITTVVNGSPIYGAIYKNQAGIVIGYQFQGTNGVDNQLSDQLLTLPSGTVTVIVNGLLVSGITIKKNQLVPQVAQKQDITDLYTYIDSVNYLKGKVVNWYGTSIPEGGLYPQQSCAKLGAICNNLALGSSPVRISKADGTYSGLAWQNYCYALAQTTSEKQYIIDNWSTIRTSLTNSPPTTLDSTEQTKILQSSYEYRLLRYLNGTLPMPDLFIFDHGRNDNFSTDSDSEFVNVPSTRNDRRYFIGAMNYLIDLILQYNPFAKIAFVGHYENSDFTRVATAQINLAEYWDFPLLKTWEKTGWSLQKAPNSKTLWTQAPWNLYTSGQDTSQDMTVRRVWLPDNIHPYSATNGKPQALLTQIMVKYLSSL